MSVREYIGARYVPLFMGEWDNAETYEPLTVVTYEGNSYTSRQFVPEGVSITNEIYWAPTGNYNAQIESYRQEVQEISADIENAKYNTHNFAFDTAYSTYVDGVNGDDDTGIVGTVDSESHPFKTLEKAFEEMQARGSDIRVKFASAGTYYFPARIIAGAVIHLNALVDNVEVVVKNDYGNIFFYDSHLNLEGPDDGNITFTVKNTLDVLGQFECEGSTLWTKNVVINCLNLYPIQGSVEFLRTTVNGYMNCWLAKIRFHTVTINNIYPYPALSMMVCDLRLENSAIVIGENTLYGATQKAIDMKSSSIRLNNNFTIVNRSYKTVIAATASIIYASDTYYNNWRSQGIDDDFDLDTTLRVRGNSANPSLHQSIATSGESGIPVPANDYHDYDFTFSTPFKTAPAVIAWLESTSETGELGGFYACAHTITTTGCKVRVFNNTANSRTPRIHIMCIG